MNKWRNPTGWLCAVAMPFALLLLSGCGSSDALQEEYDLKSRQRQFTHRWLQLVSGVIP
ncbi:hypothetical protein J3V17_001877 [Salmonella enterica]|nr:hypothetical protein [Salmonella enterica]